MNKAEVIDNRPSWMRLLPDNHPDYLTAEEYRMVELASRGVDVDE